MGSIMTMYQSSPTSREGYHGHCRDPLVLVTLHTMSAVPISAMLAKLAQVVQRSCNGKNATHVVLTSWASLAACSGLMSAGISPFLLFSSASSMGLMPIALGLETEQMNLSSLLSCCTRSCRCLMGCLDTVSGLSKGDIRGLKICKHNPVWRARYTEKSSSLFGLLLVSVLFAQV